MLKRQSLYRNLEWCGPGRSSTEFKQYIYKLKVTNFLSKLVSQLVRPNE